jgi:hypothetical protein
MVWFWWLLWWYLRSAEMAVLVMAEVMVVFVVVAVYKFEIHVAVVAMLLEESLCTVLGVVRGAIRPVCQLVFRACLISFCDSMYNVKRNR